jgi:polyisoprenoid-binding protein YceI
MKNILIIGLFVLGFQTIVLAQEKRKIEANKKNSSVSYAMKHPMHDWDAKTKEAKAVIVYNDKSQKIEAAAVIIPVKSFDSGNSNRDSHALEVLDALKIPNVTFTGANIVETGNDLLIKGNLSFHGVTKPVEIKATRALNKKSLKIVGSFLVNMNDYKIDPPGLMGIKTNENIKLSFDLSFEI